MRTLSAIVDLCKAGRRELLRRWADNELTIRQVWTAAMGATTCIEKIVAGGEDAMVDEAEAERRTSVCDTCPSRTAGAAARVNQPDGSVQWVRSWYCGPALEPKRSVPDSTDAPTCGCLLATEVVMPEGENKTVRLRVLPACASLLREKSCWQGKW